MSDLIENAFVLGAGLGTRLRPSTTARPKPLMPIFGKPLITFALDHLRAFGVQSFVINTHHLASQFDEFFETGFYAGHSVKLVHETDLLGTGGGIKNAEGLIGKKPFIVYSGDILTDIDLGTLVEEHFRQENDATLALRETGLAAGVALHNGRIVDIGSQYGHPGEYDFANVSVWNEKIYQRISPGEKKSFVPVLADWLGQGGRIGGVVLNGREWFNIGSRTDYLAVHQHIGGQFWKPAYVDAPDWPVRISRSARIAPTAQISGATAIGENALIGENAQLHDCIVWGNAEIAPDTSLRNCIVTAGQRVEGAHTDADF